MSHGFKISAFCNSDKINLSSYKIAKLTIFLQMQQKRLAVFVSLFLGLGLLRRYDDVLKIKKITHILKKINFNNTFRGN